MLNKNQLIKFENEIAKIYNQAKIKYPIHLSSHNESKLIKIFKKIKKNDWIFCSWRSHYHCLLKGVPLNKVKKEIIKEGKSIALCFPEHNVYSSAIVGGIIPIATGVAFSNKIQKKNSKVYCFVGDMTSETGIMHECLKFSKNKKLSIHFIIEDNGKSVGTDTKKVWSLKNLTNKNNKYVSCYKYKLSYPHAGSGTWINF